MKKKLIDELTVLMANKWQPRSGSGIDTKAQAIDMAEGVLAFRQTLEESETLDSIKAILHRTGTTDAFTEIQSRYYADKKVKAQAETEETLP